MATKQDIMDSIRGVDERLTSLAPAIVAHLSQPLPTGTWTIHDAVCHLAADADGVPAYVQRMQRVVTGQPGRPAGFDGNAYNEEQIEKRKHKPIHEVLDELHAGLTGSVAKIEALDDAFLQTEVANFRGEVSPIAEQMRRYLGGHPMGHLDEIEEALKAAK